MQEKEQHRKFRRTFFYLVNKKWIGQQKRLIMVDNKPFLQIP